MVPCKSTAEEVSFGWSHHRISLTDSKVRTTLHVSIIDSGIERVDFVCTSYGVRALTAKVSGYFVPRSLGSILRYSQIVPQNNNLVPPDSHFVLQQSQIVPQRSSQE